MLFQSGLPLQRKKAITDALAGLLYLDLRPAAVVEGRGLQWLIKVLEPRYEIPHRTTLMRTHLVDAYHNVKEMVRENLKKASHFSLGSDGWTDNYRRLSYISVVVAFVTDDWKFVRYVLSNRHLPEHSTGKNIAESSALRQQGQPSSAMKDPL